MKTAVLFLFLIGAALQGRETVEGVKQVTIDAAYTTKFLLNLVVGNKMMILSKTMKFEYVVLTITMPPALAQLSKQAAASSDDDSVREIFFYGPDKGLFVKFTDGDKTRNLVYNTSHPIFANGGPDAAAKKGNNMYVFKGDKMAVMVGEDTFADPTKLPSGMPNDIDAAWNAGDNMIILKGNEIWTWASDGRVSASSKFHDVYSLQSWELKPYTEE